MGFLLRERASTAVELMDLPDCDPHRLNNTYRQFAVINRTLSGWRRLYVRELRPLLAEGPASLLDIGSGGGDVAVMLARWALRDGFTLYITGIDPDPRAASFAQKRPPVHGVQFRAAHSADLVDEGRSYDVVISNHVLHHLAEDEVQQLLEHSEALAGRKALHNDLRRSPAAFALFSVAALPFRDSFIRTDGLTSIRRSYTPEELRAIAPAGWSVERSTGFHQVLSFRRN
ncbi:class I SAM-dependent methyltransferase [Pseudarthrobacter sp. NamE2]|uniref:class I SAM-dependent methyltransferase n=1 Tax=Pseudarthrobacter sp. NamE2 TaxID=2576838 RepID=UPI00210201FD|nr:class I SAM-dependent methyltransferase [Pseudarthrobacter sp. NamE2]